MSEVDELRARVRTLESENANLRKPRTRTRGASIVAGIVLVLAVLIAPIAAMGTWARLQLVDADQFVATFAPLAEDPEVQDFVADQVSLAIQEQVDLTAVVGEVFDGLRALDLPPRAESALTLLEVPAASGLVGLVDTVVSDLVASEQFATIWAESLRFTHERAVAVMQDSPDIALQLAEDGVLSVDVGIVVARVKTALTERGVGFADLIPEIDRSIPIAQADALVLTRTIYQVAVSSGFWLPWIVFGFLIVGVLLARNRPRALLWTSLAFTLVFLLFAAGLGIGRGFFARAVSPSIMTSAAADSIFDVLTSLLSSTVIAIALVGALVSVWAWIAGSSASARKMRAVTESGFGAIRQAGAKRGVTTGRFGTAVERFRGPILVAAMLLAVVTLIWNRPVSVGMIVGVTVTLIALVIVVELVRRPDTDPEPAGVGATVLGAAAADSELDPNGVSAPTSGNRAS